MPAAVRLPQAHVSANAFAHVSMAITGTAANNAVEHGVGANAAMSLEGHSNNNEHKMLRVTYHRRGATMGTAVMPHYSLLLFSPL